MATEQEVEREFDLQVAKCDARWISIERSLKETKASLHEILTLLRGEGTGTGLVGKVEANRQRLDGAAKVIRALWVLIAGIIATVVGYVLRRS